MDSATLVGLGTFISGVGGLLLGAFAFFRSWRQEAQRLILNKNSTDAKEAASASSVGLRYLQEAMAAQQREITRQEGRIGELLQALKTTEARYQQQLRDLQAEIADLKRELGHNE